MDAHTGTTGGTSESLRGSDCVVSQRVCWFWWGLDLVRCEENVPTPSRGSETQNSSQTNTPTNKVTGWESVWHAAAGAGSGSSSADHLDALVAVFKVIYRFFFYHFGHLVLSGIQIWFIWCLQTTTTFILHPLYKLSWFWIWKRWFQHSWMCRGFQMTLTKDQICKNVIQYWENTLKQDAVAFLSMAEWLLNLEVQIFVFIWLACETETYFFLNLII